MCFSLVFACLSVSQSRGWISGALHRYTSLTSLLPTLETAQRGMVPKFRRNKQAGLFHSGSRVLYVWVCMCMYVHGEPVCKYVQGERESHCHRGWGRGVARGKACLSS